MNGRRLTLIYYDECRILLDNNSDNQTNLRKHDIQFLRYNSIVIMQLHSLSVLTEG